MSLASVLGGLVRNPFARQGAAGRWLPRPARREAGARVQGFDQPLLWVMVALLAWGLVMVYSASIALAEADKATGHQSTYFLFRQAIYVMIGVAAAFGMALAPLLPGSLGYRALASQFIIDESSAFALARLLDEMDDYREESAEWVSRHRAFHEYLCSLSGRPRLLKQISALYSLIEAPMRLWLQHVEKPLSARQEHVVILDALRAGDADKAEAVVRAHIEGTVPELINFLQAKK